MNEESRKALEAVNRRPKFFPQWIQNALGALMVALIVAGFTRGCSLWDRVDSLDEEFKLHVREGRGKHRLIDREIEQFREFDRRLRGVENTVAHIPHELPYPFDEVWQNRILKNTESILSCGCARQYNMGKQSGQR